MEGIGKGATSDGNITEVDGRQNAIKGGLVVYIDEWWWSKGVYGITRWRLLRSSNMQKSPTK